MLEFKKAVRKSVPLLVSIASPSGGGKTYSALLLAAGMAGPTGRVGFLDTENGRGTMYEDSPGIKKALPNGYEYAELQAPFSPDRYIQAIKAAEQCGINVLVIDSVTHEWEGIGGCTEIAETKKLRGMPNWALAKKEHKLFVLHCLSSTMHIVFCIRARDKVKIVKVMKNGQEKEEIVPIGITPITEKNFVYEMMVSLMLDEATHCATPIKVPEPLAAFFPGGKLITMEDGRLIAEWNSVGAKVSDAEHLSKRARVAAEGGTEAYRAFFLELTAAQKKLVQPSHEENKFVAEQADVEAKAAQGSDNDPLP